MHRKTILKPYFLWNNQTISATTQTAPTSTEYLDRMSIQITVGAGLTAQPTIQVSNDKVTWFDLPLSMAPITGSTEEYCVDVQETSFQWFRVNMTVSGGSAVVSASIGAKES